MTIISKKENQDIEFKQSWRDEYIKWICAFANAKGGVLYIGVEDKGTVVGIKDAKRQLEDIPNKVKDILGIIIDLKMITTEDEKEYLEIMIEPYPYPISYKGQYHYRSGSSKQELKGASLDKFLLAKQGKRWDGVPIPFVTVNDLDQRIFETFKQKAIKQKRVDNDILDENIKTITKKLHLFDGDYLKRAAVLLFHPDPEEFITGSYIKIGYFKTDSELIYQDKIGGNILEQIDKCIELIFTKYLKAYISYEGIQRVESFPLSELAFREAITNAVVHKNYGSLNPIQISVYDDKLLIWNSGELPPNWTINTLKQKHQSEPYNPAIANVFFLAGFIESWGRGIDKITKESEKFNNITPNFRFDNGLWVEFEFNDLSEKNEPRLGDRVGDKLGNNRQNIIKYIGKDPHISISELSRKIGISTTSIERNINYLKDYNFLSRVGSTKNGYWVVYNLNISAEEIKSKLGNKLGDNRQKILKYIKSNNRISISELTKKIGISSTSIEKNITYLKDNDYLSRVGSAKSGYWKIL